MQPLRTHIIINNQQIYVYLWETSETHAVLTNEYSTNGFNPKIQHNRKGEPFVVHYGKRLYLKEFE